MKGVLASIVDAKVAGWKQAAEELLKIRTPWLKVCAGDPTTGATVARVSVSAQFSGWVEVIGLQRVCGVERTSQL